MPTKSEQSDLAANLGKAAIIAAAGLIPAVSAGGAGWPLLGTLLPAIGFLAAAYDVPLAQPMKPSRKRQVPPSPADAVD